MLIIFGFRIRLKTLGSLAFFCPRCGGDRTGVRREARRWFTLFFLPIVPLGRLGELVECETCHTRFDPEVADQPTSASLAEVLGNAARALTVMIVRTGDTSSAALRAAAVAELAPTVPGYADATLEGDLAAIDPFLAEQYVAPLADGLAVAGKERLVGDLVRVALADGTITPDQRRVIDQVGRGLALTPVHVTGIVTSVVAARTPDPDPPAP